MKDTDRLRAAIFERSGIAIDEKDPIMGVLAVCAQQTEDIGARLLRRQNPERIVLVSAAISLLFASIASVATWQVARAHATAERGEWVRQASNPRIAMLVSSDQGRAALRLAELRVASLLATCSGRSSWRIRDGYCVPETPDGRPDGFKIGTR